MTTTSGIAPVASAPLGAPQMTVPKVHGKGRARRLIKRLTTKLGRRAKG